MTTSTESQTEATPQVLATYTDPTARVELMPPEIVAARAVRAVQRRLVLLIVVVLLAITAATVWFSMDRAAAGAELRSETALTTTLRGGLTQYLELPRIQSEGAAIDRTLQELMTDDIAWDGRLLALNTPALGDIQFTAMTMSVADVGTAVAAEPLDSPGSLDASGAEHIGTMTVTGQASSHDVVAAWVASLSDVDGFRVPYILGSRYVTEGSADIEFTVEITLDSTARTQRYTTDSAAADPVTDASGTATAEDD